MILPVVLLDRGERLVEILKQKQHTPLSMEETSVNNFLLLWKVYLEGIDTVDIERFETDLLSNIRNKHSSILEKTDERKNKLVMIRSRI